MWIVLDIKIEKDLLAHIYTSMSSYREKLEYVFAEQALLIIWGKIL